LILLVMQPCNRVDVSAQLPDEGVLDRNDANLGQSQRPSPLEQFYKAAAQLRQGGSAHTGGVGGARLVLLFRCHNLSAVFVFSPGRLNADGGLDSTQLLSHTRKPTSSKFCRGGGTCI
jgi:hypothetical protein